MIRAFLAGAALALLSACATTPPPPDPSVMRAAQSRHYDLPPERVTAAAREVLRLSDSDIKIGEEAHGFTALRSFGLMYSGDYLWRFEAERADTGTDAFASVVDIPDPGLYEMLWRRMDYLLGLQATWPTCAAVEGSMKPRSYALWCGQGSDDKQPSGPLP